MNRKEWNKENRFKRHAPSCGTCQYFEDDGCELMIHELGLTEIVYDFGEKPTSAAEYEAAMNRVRVSEFDKCKRWREFCNISWPS